MGEKCGKKQREGGKERKWNVHSRKGEREREREMITVIVLTQHYCVFSLSHSRERWMNKSNP